MTRNQITGKNKELNDETLRKNQLKARNNADTPIEITNGMLPQSWPRAKCDRINE